jgi:hypothetical protein
MRILRSAPCAVTATLFAITAPAACSTTIQPMGEAPDGGPAVDSGTSPADDGATSDASADVSIDATPPVGGQLVAGSSLSVRGITSDGYVVYSDDAALTLSAIPLNGGAPQSIGALGSKFWVTIAGQVVFAWSNVNGSNVGALTTWSSANGAHAVSSASFGIDAASSPDGKHILYLDNVDAQGQVGDVYVAGSDGTGPTRLLTAQSLPGCFPQLGFAGSFVLASHCDVPRGPGPSSIISSFASPAWARIDLMGSAANYWSVDPAATKVLVSTSGGVLVVPIGGGGAMTIDPEGFMGQLMGGGRTAIYSTVSHALRRSPVSAPSPMMLAPDFGGFYALSPDESWLLFFEMFGSTGADVYMTSPQAPGTPVALWTTPTGTVAGDAFTADSSHALYTTNVDPSTGVGTLNAVAVGSSASVVLGKSVWAGWAATAAKVVFNDHFAPSGGLRFGRADVEIVDLATGGPPTQLANMADAVITLSPARDAVVYSWSAQPGGQAGLYVSPIR